MNRHDLMPKPPLAAVVRINASFLLAACTGFLAWACWPSGPNTWLMAVISGLLGIVAVNALVQALALIFRIYRREREIAAMLSSGQAQHRADLASADALRRARMTDD